MFFERTPVEEYAKLADTFDPKDYNPREWARIARQAGIKYMVMTARHHDGFCLFNSKVSDFTSVKRSPQNRDYVAEYVEACRAEGLLVGIYYSELDWRFPGYFHYKTEKENADALRHQGHEQIRELMTNYGKIDILWYDGLWLAHDPKTDSTDSPIFWQAKEMNEEVRRLQPGIVINNRLGTPEDFSTPEGRIMPPKEPNRPWECCMTMTNGWGYYGGEYDAFARSAPFIIKELIDCASDNGNYLVNVGITPEGRIPREAVQTLNTIGEWMWINGESIYGAGSIDFQKDHYAWTKKGDAYYFHLYSYPRDGRKVFPLMDAKVKKISILGSDYVPNVEYASNGRLIIAGLPQKPPVYPFLTLKIEFESTPKKIVETDPAAWLFGKA